MKGRIAALTAAAAGALLLALFNAWLAFGFAAWVVMIAMLLIGFGDRASKVKAWAAVIFAVQAAFLIAISVLDNPTGEPQLWLGLPRATAVLVYGVWPFGTLAGLLYAVEFDRLVLPAERLERFEREHARTDLQPPS